MVFPKSEAINSSGRTLGFTKKIFLTFWILIASLQGKASIEVIQPDFFIDGMEETIEIKGIVAGDLSVQVNGKEIPLTQRGNSFVLSRKFVNDDQVEVYNGKERISKLLIKCIPAWFSILPPLLAIILALLFREVISSIFIGIFSGGLIIGFYTDGWMGPFTALFALIDRYILQSLYDTGHISVVLFSLLIGASVHVISKNGGMKGVVYHLSNYAVTRRSGQFVTYILGIAIFFDDYANTLIVGNTMRPVTDKLRISREKLSYIVDSTAAPVAAIAFVTTWIGAELGYIEDGVKMIQGLDEGAYQIFLSSLQYSFYPILTLVFMGMLIYMKRDFGPMYAAETSAMERSDEVIQDQVNVSENEMKDFEPDQDVPGRWLNAVIPVLTILFVTIGGLMMTGFETANWDSSQLNFLQKLSNTIGNADAYRALLWGSISGLMVAIMLSLIQGLLSLQECAGSVLNGFKTMLPAMVILVLAWSLSSVTEDLRTADFLANAVSGNIPPYFVPASTFILAALVSFSTGSSWGCMAILYPLVLPLSWSICQETGLDQATSMLIFYNTVSTVLAGSVLGDHCSPISDTTILSSLASSCNHIEHVRTQLPYALLVGMTGLLIGTIPAAFGVPTYISFIVSILVLALIIKKFGKSTA
ncbi:MAG: Na+/H+ antiporter NhaC family protein [Vicingaceae bacterium]